MDESPIATSALPVNLLSALSTIAVYVIPAIIISKLYRRCSKSKEQ
jgi:hypothetical protein